MNVREFLKSNKDIKISQMARTLWPNNISAEAYLLKKINGQLPLTDKDLERIKTYLHELGITLTNLT